MGDLKEMASFFLQNLACLYCFPQDLGWWKNKFINMKEKLDMSCTITRMFIEPLKAHVYLRRKPGVSFSLFNPCVSVLEQTLWLLFNRICYVVNHVLIAGYTGAVTNERFKGGSVKEGSWYVSIVVCTTHYNRHMLMPCWCLALLYETVMLWVAESNPGRCMAKPRRECKSHAHWAVGLSKLLLLNFLWFKWLYCSTHCLANLS